MFLPKDYKIPEGGKPYTRLEQGDNRIRVLGNPIMGMEYWIDTMENGKEKRQPVRCRMDEPTETSNIPEPETLKHFWAMIIWNYNTARLEVLEITQKTIMKAIKAYATNEAWGDPKGTDGYDFVITRTGEGLETEYLVTANPKTKLDKDIVNKFEKSDINIEALFDGDDPFMGTPIDTKEID